MKFYLGDPNDLLRNGITFLERHFSYGYLVALAELYPEYVRFDFAKIADRSLPYNQRVDMVAEEASTCSDNRYLFMRLFDHGTTLTEEMMEELACIDNNRMTVIHDELTSVLFRVSTVKGFEPASDVVKKLQYWGYTINEGINYDATLNTLKATVRMTDSAPLKN